jgi:hypothetical protein
MSNLNGQTEIIPPCILVETFKLRYNAVFNFNFTTNETGISPGVSGCELTRATRPKHFLKGLMMSKTAATVAKHKTLNDFSEVKAAQAKVAEMRELVDAQKAELAKAERDYPTTTGAEAERLLTGNTTLPDIDKIRHSLKVAEEAHRMAGVTLVQVTGRAAEELCNEHRPEHLELVERVRNAVAELVDALREENTFVARFLEMGIQHPGFERPYLEIQRDLLNRFLVVRDDEFRPE